MALLRCSYCGFAIRPRAAFLSVDYCPRCLARRRVAEPLHDAEDPDAPSGSTLEVVAEAADGEEAVRRALTEGVHLAMLDVSMPRKTGLQAAREITQGRAGLRVLMLSMHDNQQYLFEAIRAGASGYVLKSGVDLLDKLGMRDRVELTRYAIRRGLVQL